ATTQINTNKTQSLEAIKTEKQQATSEINEAKNTIIIKTLIFLRLNKAC
ncbi:ATPase, partial [Helicobacter pylori]